jgi:hypothetical protein
MEARSMTLKINDLTWERFRERVPSACDLALVPVGTIEAHGAIPLAPTRSSPRRSRRFSPRSSTL